MVLGQLFVDLGVRGAGALNVLTNASIKFLSLKFAAQQAAKSFDDMFGDIVRDNLEMRKLSLSTGMTIDSLQKIKAATEQAGVSFNDYINTIKNLQKERAKILLGKGSVEALNLLNLTIEDAKDPILFIEKVMERISRLNVGMRNEALAMLGINEDIFYLYKNMGQVYFKDILSLSKEERETIEDLRRSWVKLEQVSSMFWDKMTAKGAPVMIKILDYTRKLVELWANILNSTDGVFSKVGKITESIFQPLGDAIVSAIVGDKTKEKIKSEIKKDGSAIDIIRQGIEDLASGKPRPKPRKVGKFFFDENNPTIAGSVISIPSKPPEINITQNINSSAPARDVARMSAENIQSAINNSTVLNGAR